MRTDDTGPPPPPDADDDYWYDGRADADVAAWLARGGDGDDDPVDALADRIVTTPITEMTPALFDSYLATVICD